MFWDNHVIREDLEEVYGREINWERLRNKTIFITGAYGMLTSYLVFLCIYLNEIHQYGMRLILAVRSKEKAGKRFGRFLEEEYIELYLKDINEPIAVEGHVDYVIHGASLASTQYYGTVPIDVILPNISGTVQLLKLAEEHKSEGCLLFSSGEIYGKVDSSVSMITEETMGTSDTMNLRNCYCESKRMAEMLCCAWFHQKNVPAKAVRICHTYGPTMDIEGDARVFSAFVNDIINNRNIVMNSEGLVKRPFCYLADATAGFFQILLEGKPGEAYNLCNSKEFLSIRQLAELLTGLYPQKGLKVEKRIPEGQGLISKREENEVGISDEKLKALGWTCKYDTREGFHRTIESLLQEKNMERIDRDEDQRN